MRVNLLKKIIGVLCVTMLLLGLVGCVKQDIVSTEINNLWWIDDYEAPTPPSNNE